MKSRARFRPVRHIAQAVLVAQTAREATKHSASMSTGVRQVSGVQKRKPLFRRLDQPGRQTDAQILHESNGRAPPRRTPEGQITRSKKYPGLRTLQGSLEAWAEAHPQTWDARLIAQELKANREPIQLAAVTPLYIAEIVKAWQLRFAAATTAHRAWVLKRMLRDLEYEGLPHGIADSTPTFKQPPPRETIATPEETAKLYAEAPPFLQLFLHLLNDSGLRFAEAFRCAPEHFDPQTHTVTLPVKGGNLHTVPVSPATERLFRLHHADPSVPYVAALHGKTSMSKGTLRWHWRKAKAATGVNPDLWPHDLRRTTAVALYESSKDLRAVQELLGHTNMATTVRYLAHRDPARLRPLMRELWNRHKGEK